MAPSRFEPSPADCLSFSPPAYLGVSRSTQTLFPDWHGLTASDVATSARRERWASRIARTGAWIVVLSGFEDGYGEAARVLREREPAVKIAVVWHGSTLQLADADERVHFERLLELTEERVVDRVGFMKEGMERIFARVGVPALRLMNWVDAVPTRASEPEAESGVGLGVWFAGASWRKNPYAMLCAAALVPGARVSGIFDRQALDWCRRIDLPTGTVSTEPLPPDTLRTALARQHCNLYVTLSECSPLLPLESFAAGAPCLVAANSDLFRDDARLSDALVVTRPDDPHAIAEHALSALAEREEIVADYARYAVGYNARACELRDRFLEF